MLYTGLGDTGTTTLRDTRARVSKSAERIEALGSIDELTSYLGYCRACATADDDRAACLAVQHDLFTLQAQLGGSDHRLPPARVVDLEQLVNGIEQKLPPITSFCVPGQTVLSACFDVARTLARRAERRVVAAVADEKLDPDATMLSYLNRLSSLLYALARRATHRAGVSEVAPEYRS